MAKPPTKKRPYDAMKDESSRAITAMPYTEKKAKTPPPKKRTYDPVKDEPTSRPFKKGGKVIRKAEGGMSKLLTPKRLRGREGPSDMLAYAPKVDTEGLKSLPSIDASKMDTSPKASSPKSSSGSAGSFSEAFRAARNDPSKPKTFTWKGESYTTEVDGEKRSTPTPASKKGPAPAAAKPSTAAKPTPAAAKPTPAAAKPTPAAAKPAKANPAEHWGKGPFIPRVTAQQMSARFAPANQSSSKAKEDRRKRNAAVVANAKAAAAKREEEKRNPPKSWRDDDPYKFRRGGSAKAKGGKVTKKKYV